MTKETNRNISLWQERLTGRLSKLQIMTASHNLQQDKEGIREVLHIVLQQEDAHTAMNAAWVLMHLSKEAKALFLCEHREAMIDFSMQKNIKIRRGLILSVLLDIPDADEPRVDFLDYCMEEFANEQQNDSCRSTMIKLALRMCAPYPELKEELRQRLLLLPPGLPPSISSAKKKVLKVLTHK